jgi:5'-3' exonuclease
MTKLDNTHNHKFIYVIDGSWWLKSRVPVLAKSGTDLSFEKNENASRLSLISKLTLDLCNELRRLEDVVDDVIIAVDDKKSNLWRSKHQYLTREGFEQGEDAGYKGTRTYDQTINWLKVYGVYFEWLKLMQEAHGIRHIKLSEAEADDVIFMLSRYATSKGRNVLYQGTDKDLTQCVCVDTYTGACSAYAIIKNGCKANGWQKSRVLMGDKFVLEHIKELAGEKSQNVGSSIFDSFAGAQVKTRILDNPYAALLEYVDAEIREHVPSFLFYKIVLGDAGDNIPELFGMLKKRGNNWSHLSVGQIYDALKSLGIETNNAKQLEPGMRYMLGEDLYDDEVITMFLTAAYKTFMNVDSVPADDFEWLKARFAENRQLACLNAREVPRHIFENFMYTMSFTDITKPSCKVYELVDAQSTITALGINAATYDITSKAADAQFGDTFINNMFQF